jgi:hypothetical protein
MKYRIRRIDCAGDETRTVRATGYDHAAEIFARHTWGRNAVVRRVTGELGKSGCFRAYQERSNGESSYGEQFHVGQE